MFATTAVEGNRTRLSVYKREVSDSVKTMYPSAMDQQPRVIGKICQCLMQALLAEGTQALCSAINGAWQPTEIASFLLLAPVVRSSCQEVGVHWQFWRIDHSYFLVSILQRSSLQPGTSVKWNHCRLSQYARGGFYLMAPVQ